MKWQLTVPATLILFLVMLIGLGSSSSNQLLALVVRARRSVERVGVITGHLSKFGPALSMLFISWRRHSTLKVCLRFEDVKFQCPPLRSLFSLRNLYLTDISLLERIRLPARLPCGDVLSESFRQLLPKLRNNMHFMSFSTSSSRGYTDGRLGMEGCYTEMMGAC